MSERTKLWYDQLLTHALHWIDENGELDDFLVNYDMELTEPDKQYFGLAEYSMYTHEED